MALPEINSTQFVGEIKIVLNPAGNDFQPYIDDNYESYVCDVIGAEATNEIKTTTTLPQKWNDLFNGVYYYNVSLKKWLRTRGLTYAVLRIIYFEYVGNDHVATMVGNVRGDEEVATRLNPYEEGLNTAKKYNRAQMSVNSELSLWFDNYRNFEGNIDSFVDNGGGSYTINSASTIYLANGDKVKIGNIEYVVSNVVDNVSFDISAETGLSFNGKYVYNPFEKVCFSPQEFIVA